MLMCKIYTADVSESYKRSLQDTCITNNADTKHQVFRPKVLKQAEGSFYTGLTFCIMRENR